MKVIKGLNDFGTIAPDIAAEWHPTLNGDLLPSMFSRGSNRVVFWLGKCGHVWETSIHNRCKYGSGCPYCANQKVLKGYNDLATTKPELLDEWDWNRNSITPYEITRSSNKKVAWRCKNGHCWMASPNHRSQGRGCPICANKMVLAEYNSLAVTNPELALEWDYEKNKGTPSEYTASSNKKAYWKCSLGHSWYAQINSRNQGKGCPYCANQKVLAGFNDLGTKRPDIASEWNYQRNILTPQEITCRSAQKVWWVCSQGHEWEETVYNRFKGNECPLCSRYLKTSFPEQAIYFYIRKCYFDAVNRYTDVFSNGMELDIFIPSLLIGIEYDGPYHNSTDSFIRDHRKYEICKSQGIKLIRVKTNASERDIENCDNLIYSKFNTMDDVSTINEIIVELAKLFPLEVDFDALRDYSKIKAEYKTYIVVNSLALEYPELCKEWCYDKNGELNPRMFTSGSAEKIWWQCSNGHTWKAAIYSRTAGRGCPVCTNQKVIAGENDLASIRPDIAVEWDYSKNEFGPDEVTKSSGKKVWWVCKNGHESYLMRITDKCKGKGCPKCKSQKIRMKISKKVYQYSVDGKFIAWYNNATEAAKIFGVSSSAIGNACRGTSKSCGGYVWSYEYKAPEPIGLAGGHTGDV